MEPADTSTTAQPGRRLLLALVVFIAAMLAVLIAWRPSIDPGLGQGLGRAAAGIPTPARPAAVPRPPLPLPDPLPADPYEPTPHAVIGRIDIPEIGLTDDVQTGMSLTAIDRGPGWWPGTAMPGEVGNVVVAGHRTTHSRPFHGLHELEPGDPVVFTTSAGRFVYEVRAVIVVPADWIDIAAQSYAHTATLFACHPIGSARERIVVKLRMLDPTGQPTDPDSALPAIDAEAQRPDHTLLVREPGDSAAVAGADPLSATDG